MRTIGIDLGTTNSVIAFLDGQRVETIPNSEGQKTTPSVVFYKSDDEIIVGNLAKRQSLLQPHRCIRSIKRLMGKRYAELAEFLDEMPFKVVELDDGMAGVELEGGARLRPEEVSADILDRLRIVAEGYLGEDVQEVVITVPAHFNDQQRTATKSAAEMAGLSVLRIINEPTAAALAYGLERERKGRVAVFDFGGGTFDVSILQISKDIFEVLSTNGDNNLGGDDIDRRFYQELCDNILQETGIDPTQDSQAIQRINEAAEKAKCELSSLTSTTVSLPFIVADSHGPKHFQRDVTRQQFNELMEPIFQRLIEPCKRALKDANLTPRDLEEVLLVGGSTRIPRVQEIVREYFGREPNRSINPDEAVGAGAAIQSGVISGALREVLLLDVAPLTLGIELAGGVFRELIPRNSTIPCEANRKFTTVVDNQTSVLVHVLQGERKKASNNHSLAKFRLVGIPPAPKELPEIDVHFSIDANGILSVTATDMTTGQQTGVVVEEYGQIGGDRKQVEKLVEDAVAHEDEDRDFVRFADRRARAARLSDLANRTIAAVGDAMTDEDLKRLKEGLLKLDLAIEAQKDVEVDTLEAEIQELLQDYQENYELHLALNREFDGFALPPSNPGGVSTPAPVEEEEEDLQVGLEPEEAPPYEPPLPPAAESSKDAQPKPKTPLPPKPKRANLPPKPTRRPARKADKGTMTPPPFSPGSPAPVPPIDPEIEESPYQIERPESQHEEPAPIDPEIEESPYRIEQTNAQYVDPDADYDQFDPPTIRQAPEPDAEIDEPNRDYNDFDPPTIREAPQPGPARWDDVDLSPDHGDEDPDMPPPPPMP
ncbi:molecular chaperone DnaK [bacterium]|nr:molecular chaperone DnaK [bacterium]